MQRPQGWYMFHVLGIWRMMVCHLLHIYIVSPWHVAFPLCLLSEISLLILDISWSEWRPFSSRLAREVPRHDVAGQGRRLRCCRSLVS